MKKNNKIQKALLVYWLLLVYIVAALIWWYISLEKQNKALTKQAILISNSIATSNIENESSLQTLQKRNTKKHLSEGITFLAIILIGAVYIYRLVKKQLDANKQQNNFIMAVTHELKTPIAITQLNVETLQKHKVDDATKDKLLKNAKLELQRLNDLSNNILVVSQIEHQGYQLKKETTSIAQLLTETIAAINERFDNKVQFTQDGDDKNVLVDILLIKLVFTNLIDNALKYAATGAQVQVVLQTTTTDIKVKVIDNGTGVPLQEQKKIFEKFYRQENELTRKQKGTGLGLYICKKIITDHKGNIAVYNNTPTGAIFEVILKS